MSWKTDDPPVLALMIGSNPDTLDLLSNSLAQSGLEILTASDPEQGVALALRRQPLIILVELATHGMNGFEVLDRIVAACPAADVVVISGKDSAESAVEAMKRGAKDYWVKPIVLPVLWKRLEKLVEDAHERQCRDDVDGEKRTDPDFDFMIGRSARMLEMFAAIRKVAPHYRSLIITGETGTGKDLVARAVHQLSPAAADRLVVLNCSAVVETLFESELFGHTRGSFTGATQDKPGLFEVADGGTLFLDEIADMSLAVQAKLLRALETREVRRVGGLHGRQVDVRVIAATNQDLRAAVAERRFREDLYYRLSMVEIKTPSLAEHLEDLPLLESHLVARFAAEYRKEILGVTPRVRSRLAQHSWPGNVRELENVLGYAAMMAADDRIDLRDLPLYLRNPLERSTPNSCANGVSTLEEHERQLLKWALESTDGNQSKAARMLGIGRDALRYKIKKNNVHSAGPQEVSAAAG